MSKDESRIRKKVIVEPTLADVDDMPVEYMNHNEKNLTKRQRLLVWNAVNDPTLTFAEAAKKAGFKNPKVVSRYMSAGGKYQHVYREYERLMGEVKKKFELTHEGAVEDLYKLRDAVIYHSLLYHYNLFYLYLHPSIIYYSLHLLLHIRHRPD